jgi:hypothetical protein
LQIRSTTRSLSSFLAQLEQKRELLHPGIGRDNHAHDLPALRSQLASERLLVVPAEVADDLLDNDASSKAFLRIGGH